MAKKTYRIQLNDFTKDEVNTLNLDIDYPDLESAAEAAWALTEYFAHSHNLDIENQGDQFMAFYKDGHPDAGVGAMTALVFDNDGNQIEDL